MDKSVKAYLHATGMAGALNYKKPAHKPPKNNRPCKDCGKPTRSHWDSETGEVQCHVCHLKSQDIE